MQYKTIRNADCMKGIKDIPTGKAKLIIIDPPYNIAHKREFTRGKTKAVSMDFGEWDYFETKEEYLEWCEPWIEETYRSLDDDGHVFVWQDKTLPLIPLLEKYGFEIRNIVVWIKSNPVPSFQKVNFLSAIEFGVWATKKGSLRKNQTFNFLTQNQMHNVEIEKIKDMTKEELFEYIMSLVHEDIKSENKNEIYVSENGIEAYKSSIVMGKERTPHPTQKPLSFTKKLIQLFTNEGDLVVDFFSGSGTVAEASEETGRDYYCCEKSKEWYDVSVSRLLNKGYTVNCLDK